MTMNAGEQIFEDAKTAEPSDKVNYASAHTNKERTISPDEVASKWTVYDDINFIIAQNNLTSTRVQNTFIYLANELRAYQIKNLELTNYINEKEGRELVALPHIPINEPDVDGYGDLIAIHSRTAKSLMWTATGCFALCFVIACALAGLTMMFADVIEKAKAVFL